MAEYGVFNDEGCFFVADTLEETEAKAAEEREADDGYYADLIRVHELCPEHAEQPKYSCEECFAD